MRVFKRLTTLLLCGSLVACGGSGGSGKDSSTLSLRVTDAPIDDALSVVVEFVEVRLRNTDGNWTSHPLNPSRKIDLLKLQGIKTADLLLDQITEAGNYDEIRLLVNDAPMANHIDLGVGGVVGLKIPSGSASGLKIKKNFSVMKNRDNSLVIDFDLRQSITVAGNSGNYILKPVIRLVSDKDSGHIRGTVNPLLLSTQPACTDTNADTYNAVYVFAGHNVTPDDIDQSAPAGNAPFATTSIAWDDASMSYLYEAAFLPEGDYTIALTCNANLEDLDDGNDDLKFFNVQNVTVLANDTLFL